jgi:hypothetical protein
MAANKRITADIPPGKTNKKGLHLGVEAFLPLREKV